MECNREEARREMAMAEERIESNDLPGAMTFAQRAQALDPELDGISQMLSMLDVNISAQRRMGGEIDWYGVLGVDPTADDDTIENRYRDLAQALHPDTNPSSGASSAFSLVSRARSLLSDPARRATYDRIAGYLPIEGVVLPESSSARASTSRAEVAMTWHDDSPHPTLYYVGKWKQRVDVFVRYGGPCFIDTFFPDEFEAGTTSSGGPSEAFMDDGMLQLVERMIEEDDMYVEPSTSVPANNNIQNNVPEEGGGGGVGVPGNNHQNVGPEEKAESVYACW